MSEETTGPDDAVLNILEQCILARERGAAVDLKALCNGDTALIERIERLLASEPESMQRLSSGEAAAGAKSSPKAAELDAAELEIEALGEFRLLARIGRGGMGTVYLAQQSALGRKVALKVLDSTSLQDRARVRFHREAEIAASLEHPHIVPIYGIGEDKGRSYIAMKLLSGPGLDAVEKPVAPREAARIGAAAARALDVAHLSGIVHRDVKPANIILDHGEPCLVDFGLARAQTDVTLTRQGTVPGTLTYLAPELMRGGAGLDPRSDVYALGATLYELLAGRPPFEGNAPEQLVSQILLQEPRPLRLRSVDRDLETIVMRALEKEPERRFASALEMAEDLERYLAGEPILSRRSSLFDRGWKLARRHRTASALLGTSALVAIGLAALLSWQVIGKLRELDRNIDAAHAALERSDWAVADSVLARMADSNGGDERIVDLVARLRAERAYETLLDRLVNRPSGLRAEELEAAVIEARASGAIALHPRTGMLATATASFLLGRLERSREELSELRKITGASSAADALAGLLEGNRDAPLPADSVKLDPDERVLIGLAEWLAGAGSTGLRLQSEIVLHADPTNRRASYMLALALAEQGVVGEAERMLQGLTFPGATPRDVWRNMSMVQLKAGKLTAARESLAQIEQKDWTPVVALQYLELLLRQRKYDEFERELDKDRVRFGEVPFLSAAASYCGNVQKRYAEALDLSNRAVAAESDPYYRDLALATRFQLQCDALQDSSDPNFVIPDGERPKYEELLREGEHVIGGLRHPRAQAKVASMLGRHLLRLDRVEEGLEHLDRATELAPWELGPRYDAIWGLWQIAGAHASSTIEQDYLLSLARQRLPGTLEAAEHANCDPQTLEFLHEAIIGIALAQTDYVLAEPWLDQVIAKSERDQPESVSSLKSFQAQARLGRQAFQERR